MACAGSENALTVGGIRPGTMSGYDEESLLEVWEYAEVVGCASSVKR